MTRTTLKTKLMLPVKHLLSVQSRRQDARTTSWELSFSRWLKNFPCWPKISECPGSQRCRVWWRKTGSESCQTTWFRRDGVRLCTPAHPRCGPGPAGSASARWRWWSWVKTLIMDQARYKLSSHWLTQFIRCWLVATVLYSLLIGWYNSILTADWLSQLYTHCWLVDRRMDCVSQWSQVWLLLPVWSTSSRNWSETSPASLDLGMGTWVAGLTRGSSSSTRVSLWGRVRPTLTRTGAGRSWLMLWSAGSPRISLVLSSW